jgi:hypothetical protein
MDGTAIVTEIIEILTAGITGIATGIGSGLKSLVDNIFFTTAEGGAATMSTFGIMICVFAGISLAIGLSRLIVRWLSSLGGSRV